MSNPEETPKVTDDQKEPTPGAVRRRGWFRRFWQRCASSTEDQGQPAEAYKKEPPTVTHKTEPPTVTHKKSGRATEDPEQPTGTDDQDETSPTAEHDLSSVFQALDEISQVQSELNSFRTFQIWGVQSIAGISRSPMDNTGTESTAAEGSNIGGAESAEPVGLESSLGSAKLFSVEDAVGFYDDRVIHGHKPDTKRNEPSLSREDYYASGAERELSRFAYHPSRAEREQSGSKRHRRRTKGGPSRSQRVPSGIEPIPIRSEPIPSGSEPVPSGYADYLYASREYLYSSREDLYPSGDDLYLSRDDLYPTRFECGPSRFEHGPSRFGRGPSGSGRYPSRLELYRSGDESDSSEDESDSSEDECDPSRVERCPRRFLLYPRLCKDYAGEDENCTRLFQSYTSLFRRHASLFTRFARRKKTNKSGDERYGGQYERYPSRDKLYPSLERYISGVGGGPHDIPWSYVNTIHSLFRHILLKPGINGSPQQLKDTLNTDVLFSEYLKYGKKKEAHFIKMENSKSAVDDGLIEMNNMLLSARGFSSQFIEALNYSMRHGDALEVRNVWLRRMISNYEFYLKIWESLVEFVGCAFNIYLEDNRRWKRYFNIKFMKLPMKLFHSQEYT